jgi:hypothetical protein
LREVEGVVSGFEVVCDGLRGQVLGGGSCVRYGVPIGIGSSVFFWPTVLSVFDTAEGICADEVAEDGIEDGDAEGLEAGDRHFEDFELALLQGRAVDFANEGIDEGPLDE